MKLKKKKASYDDERPTPQSLGKSMGEDRTSAISLRLRALRRCNSEDAYSSTFRSEATLETARRADRKCKTATPTSPSRERIKGIPPGLLAKLHLLHSNKSVCTPEKVFLEVSEEDLCACWGQVGLWHTSALVPASVESPHTVRQHNVLPKENKCQVYAMLEDVGVGAICSKGRKGTSDTTPGQDNFSISRLKNGWECFVVMDGHGEDGHWPSKRGVHTIPFYMQSDSCMQMLQQSQVEAAFRFAFEAAEEDMERSCDKHSVDVYGCGSTCVCMLRNVEKHPGRLWVANVGDSRACVFTKDRKVLYQTEDHKPTLPAEDARLTQSGSVIETTHHKNGFVESRIFVKGFPYPGLSMSRSFGDLIVKNHGVTAEPEVTEWVLDPNSEVYFLAATDGVWEFFDCQQATDILMGAIRDGCSPSKACTRLLMRSRDAWAENEGEYCDDITMVLVPAMERLRPCQSDVVVHSLGQADLDERSCRRHSGVQQSCWGCQVQDACSTSRYRVVMQDCLLS